MFIFTIFLSKIMKYFIKKSKALSRFALFIP